MGVGFSVEVMHETYGKERSWMIDEDYETTNARYRTRHLSHLPGSVTFLFLSLVVLPSECFFLLLKARCLRHVMTQSKQGAVITQAASSPAVRMHQSHMGLDSRPMVCKFLEASESFAISVK